MENEHLHDAERQRAVTKAGNPSCPTGEAGAEMLSRMNRSHFEMTGWALEHLAPAAGDRILDIGCGGGMTVHRLAEMVPDGHVWGVDHSPVSVAESQKLNADAIASGKVEILEASVEALPFADQTFDRIITVESFYFWPDQTENLKEVRRVLKEGGSLLIVSEIFADVIPEERRGKNDLGIRMVVPSLNDYRVYAEEAGFSTCTIYTRARENCVFVEMQ